MAKQVTFLPIGECRCYIDASSVTGLSIGCNLAWVRCFRQATFRVFPKPLSSATMIRSNEAISLLLVGALWGCTNPFMRKGSIESKSSSTVTAQEEKEEETKSSVLRSVFRLAKIRVWLPYLVNQLGSLLYYKQLASSNLTLSVPICNAAAMVFSCITSFILGERVNQPGRAALGVILVLLGVQICMYSSGESLSMEDSI